MTEQPEDVISDSDSHRYSPSSSRERPTLHGNQQENQNQISGQPFANLIDIGINSAEESTRERPTLHGKQQKKGLWDVTNETQRTLKTRHLTMIGMYPSNSGNVV
jgi:amino acid permease